ncbi:MAG: tRNA-dihydrouridine synthase family protein [Kiritimatiellia bacterium]
MTKKGWLGFPLRELVVAPMVDQSELAFRMLCRKYGASLCFTPMLHARLFSESAKYRRSKFTTVPSDRPLIVQFCGNDPDILLAAARHVEGCCEAVDLNLGCPQNIAKRGRYGSFLLEHGDLIGRIVAHMSSNLATPVSCKIRVLPSREKTLELAMRLEDAGCGLLTVHGRTKEQNKERVGSCDWDIIRAIKERVSVPVIANGGVGTFAEGIACREATGADAVMSAEGILENPACVAGMDPAPSPTRMALDYLEMVLLYPDTKKVVQAHLFKLLHGPLCVHPEFRQQISRPCRVRDFGAYLGAMRQCVESLAALHHGDGAEVCVNRRCHPHERLGEYYPWYGRHRGAFGV